MKILVHLDGVLRGQDDAIIPTGILMVGTLTVYNNLTIMSSEGTESTERWLNQNKIVDFDNILDASIGLVGESLEERQITFARAQGTVDLFITADPNLWVYAFNMGIPSVMFGVPEYIRPEFRPDAPKRIRSWDEITKAVEAQNEARTKDIRLSRTEALNFEG